MTFKFVIPGNPVPWKAPQFSRRGAYDLKSKDKVSAIWHIKRQWKEKSIEGAVRATFIFYMPIPKSTSKRTREFMNLDLYFHLAKPDVSNMEKLYCDVLEKAAVLHNDSQIVQLFAVKKYSDNPRIEIDIVKLGDNMPLDKSKAKGAVGRNIKTELAEGKPLKQAQAISLNVARKAGAKIKKPKKK